MARSHDNTIRINLEIAVPVTGEVQMRQSSLEKSPSFNILASDIRHPATNGDSTLVKQYLTRWYMCAEGTTDSGVRHIFAKVYDGDVTNPPAEPPSGDMDVLWTRPIDESYWKFDLIHVPGNIGSGYTKTLVVWPDTGSAYQTPKRRTFLAQSSTQTYCEAYSALAPAAPAAKPLARDWSALPSRWQFHLDGCSNASAANCAILNGTWVLQRDGKSLLWVHKLAASFTDPHSPCWWRLFFNPKDGFWYLECVLDLSQPVGTSLCYRRHESAWNPCAANEMLLLTHHGYCHAPDFVTLYPA